MLKTWKTMLNLEDALEEEQDEVLPLTAELLPVGFLQRD